MRELPGNLYYLTENQSFIEIMYKTWVLIFSIVVLLPLRWLVDALPGPSSVAITALPVLVLVSCGELQLNNPTVSPAGPYCPGDDISISFTGVNLLEGDDIQVFIDDNSTYNPFNGEGTQIGSIPVDYNCTTCPQIMAVMLNPATCSGMYSNDEQSEFMVLGSGCGFDVDDFQLNPSVGGGGVNDSIGGSQGCQWSLANASAAAAFLIANGTNCGGNIFAAGPGSTIPAGAIVLAFSDAFGPSVPFNFQSLCNSGMPIYVLSSSCDRVNNFGAYSNTNASSPGYTLTSCSPSVAQLSYNAPPAPGNSGINNIIALGGASFVSSSTCTDPGLSSLNFPDIPTSTNTLAYTIPASLCVSNVGLTNFFISGMMDLNAPCQDVLGTPPSALSISLMCPAMIDPAGPFCVSGAPVQLTATPVGGTWSGGAYITAGGIFDPAIAGVGMHSVTYTVAPCGAVMATITVAAAPAFTAGSDVIPTDVACAGAFTGEAVFLGSVTGGTGAYVYDWDNANTPGNDVYADDGSFGLTGVPAGDYYFIVTDALGCADTISFTINVFAPVTYGFSIDPILCNGGTSNIFLFNIVGPPGFYFYNWDAAATGGDDDYGGPPADDDPEDLLGVTAGTYYLTVTVTDDPLFPTYTCDYLDTFVITQPAVLTVTVPDVALPCFGNTVMITATPSGGTPNYTYNWGHIAGSNDPQTVTVGVGNYPITITDANGCTASDVANITQPASALMASATGETVACNNNMGDINLTVSGGTGPYTYDWSNDGPEMPDNDPEDLSGLNGGTYTVTVTDVNGCTTTAMATITVTPPFFTPPANTGSTVPCISNAQVAPTPPVVTNNCGGPVNVTGPVVGPDPVCSGTKTYTYTYTDPATGIMATWVYTYTISPPTFTPPAAGGSTVACISNATPPTPPPTNNSCGTPLTITGPVIGPDPVCSGTKTYTYTYADCTGATAQWVYTYTITAPTFMMPAAGGSTVACISNAQTVPANPVVNNSCSAPLTVTGPVVGPDPVCSGIKTYTWTYTDCTGSSAQWVYTYTISPPTFTLLPNGNSTVPCISNAQVIPIAPNVNNSCGTPLTITGPVIGPDPVCFGNKTYTYTYTDCTGNTGTWIYTYTISLPTITLPANGASTVPCIVNAQTVPVNPVVNNSCGAPVPVTGPVISLDPPCSGPKTYTWTYTNCNGATSQWVYTYTISPPTFSVPAAGGSTVPCISNAQVVPTPPAVANSCGTVIIPTGPVVGPDPVCSGSKTYTWTYTNCTGSSLPWVYTYTISPPTFTLPPNGGSTVPCISNAQVVPTPPNVNDSCGNPITPTGPVVSADPVCSGIKTYTWTYMDCSGSSANWVYTYTISPPSFTLPASGGSTVPCISDAQIAPTPPPVNNSCGDPLIITGPVVGANPICSGTKTYTYTYTDCTGSSSPWVYTYTISPPTFSVPPAGGSTVPCISDAQVVPTPPPATNSCGAPLTISGPVVGPDPVCSGTKTYTYTYTDCTGSSLPWIYTYTINPPTANAPAGGSATVPCISDAQTVPTPPAVNNSCGDPLSIAGPVVGPDPVCSGTKTYTWTYTDCTGSTVQYVFTYTVSPPTASLPPAGSSTVPCISDAQVVPTPPAVNNSCGTPLVITGPVVGADPICSGTKTYTFTYTDCTGAATPWVYTYTISPPTFSAPAPQGTTVPCVADAQIVPTPPTVMNSCGATITPTGPVVGPDPVCGGTKTYTWTYTDCTGSSSPWVYTYTVLPTTFTLPANGSSTVPCISDAQVVPTPPSINDSCGDPVVPTGPVVGPDPVCSGTKTYTWTYTDCSGGSSNWVFTYTINAPTFSLPAGGSSTVPCISDAQTAPAPPPVNNSCGDPLIITGPVVGADPICSGTKTYTYTYTDCTGSSAPWVYTYTISPPTFSAPAPGGSTVPCVDDAQIVPTPPATNNSCGDPLTITGPVVGPDPVCSGTKTYTYTYTDCTGSSAPWVYTYTVTPPSVTPPAPGSATVPCIIDAQVVPAPPVVNNTCGDPLSLTGPVVGPDPVCSGTKTYTWTYTDCTGSTVQYVFTYTITPATPSFPAPGGSTVPCISNAQVVPTPPPADDSCGEPLVITGPAVGADPVCSGVKTYTYTYTDCSGATSPWVYTYTISPPTFSAPAPQGSTVICVADAQVVPTPPTVMNSCGATITPTGPVVGPDPVCGGTKTYTWTYTDCTGSSSPWVYTYTVQPTTFTLPPNGGSTVNCISDAQVVPAPPVVNDSCGDPVVPTGPVVSADPVCSGIKTYTWTYTDCSGGSSDWVYTYTINAPTFSLPAGGSSTVPCISNAQVTPTPPPVNNSCGAPLTITGPVVGPDPVCSGTKTYTYTYTDCTGTNGQWVFTYTITPPTFSLPAPGSSTVACISNAQVVPTPPAVNNSCGDPLVISGPVVGPDPVCSGTKTYTWTYTDCTGSSAPWVFTYTITPPTASAPAPGSSIVPCVSDAQVVPTPPAVNNSCGDPLSITGPVVGPDPVCSGTKTYTWTYTDCTGATVQYVYTYTITPPTASLPPNGSATVPCISDAQIVPVAPPVNNSCGDPLVITGPVVGADPVCSGTKTYTFTYTDCTGAALPWVFTYTISPPTFSAPAPQGTTVPCVADAQVVPTPPTVMNSCGATITPTGPVVGPDPVCGGTKTYTWTYTDCTGSSSPWVYTYTVQPTTFTLPANGSSTVPCISDAQVVPTPPGINDSCGDPVVPTGPVVGPDPVCSGTKTYTWTYTDCSGGSSNWVFTYTINAPTFSLPAGGSSTVPCISDAQVTPTPPPVNNSCGAPLTISGPVVGPDPVCSGTKTYTYTYTDCTGTNGQWVFTYTITPPTFSLPAPGSSTVACISNAQVVPTPPAVNNSCGDPLVISGPVVGPDPVCSGTKTYTWTYTDCTGSSAPWIFTYTINPPTATAPAPGSSTVACVSDAQVAPTPPTVNNSCGDPLSITGPVVGPDPVCSGTKTYTWTYTDCTGATVQYVYTYTITPPTASLPPNGSATVPCIGDAQIVPVAPPVNNSCGDPLVITGPVVGADPVCSGTKTYTFTYTDCTGAALPWVFTYTINPPTFSLPAPGASTVPCVSDAQVVPSPPTVMNSCGATITPTGPVVGPDPVCGGTKTYTWTYTDCTGTGADWVFTYTVSPLTFTLPSNDGSIVACISDAQVVPTPPVVNDSCGDPVIPSGPLVSADPVCSGIKTYTWTYADCSGGTTDWVYTYTISAPTLTLPPPGSAIVNCISDAQTVPTPPVVNDSCGDPVTPTGPVVGPDPVCSGTKTYTWTYTDCSGSASDWVFTYTINAPTFTLPAPGNSTVPCIADAQVVPTPPAVDNSCGDPLVITGPVVGADPVCSGNKTYTWTYTDCTGSSAPWIFTYMINPPTATAPAPGSSTVACVSDAQVVPTPPTVNNSCGDPLSIAGPVVGPDPVCSGTKTYTWTYTDCTGSTVQYIYTYTVDPPTASLPADGAATVPCISDAQVVPIPPVVNNSCGDPLTITGPVVGPDPLCSGVKIYLFTYTDCTGSATMWAFTYTIDPPTFTLPAPGASTVPCVADAQVIPTPPSVSNSCGAVITPTGPVVGPDPVCGGAKTYTFTYTDCTGASADWVFTYTVSPVTFTLPADGSATVPCIADAQVVPVPPVINDSCGDPVIPTGPVIGPDPVCSGTKTYTWTYTDCTGGTSDWVFTYTITAPTFTLPAPGSATVGCIVDAQVVPTPPAVNDSCGDPVTPTGPVVGPDPVCSGTKTYTWTYTDCSGTTSDWVFTYTINAPTFILPSPGSATVPCIADAQVVPTPPAVDNSCGDPLVITGPVVGADPVCSGTKTYTWTYTDCTGSSAPWVFTYTIDPPTASSPTPGSSTVACISDAQVVPPPPTVNNSCGDPLTITGPVVGPDPVCSGTKTYTWTYTDCTGSTVQYVYTYTIDPPTATLPADGAATVPCIADAQVLPIPPVVNNSCGDPLTITGPVVGPDPVCSGVKIYLFTYTDCTGSSTMWAFTYTIDPPTFTLPAPGASTVPCVADAQVIPTPPSVSNSCGAVITPTGPIVGPDPVCGGTKTYTWTYTDCTGTAADWVYTYTVDPTTFSLPANGSATVPCIVDAQVVPTPPSVNDSCGDPVIPTGPVVGADPVCSGTKTYTWTYTDCSGNASQWVFTYTISPPTFALPAAGNATVNCITDAQVVPTPPSVDNSCGDPLTVTGPVVGADPVCSGTKTYTWTFTDCTGNAANWVFTYTISPPTYTLPANGSATVPCIIDAQVVPTPPAVSNSCGDPLTITGPVVGPDPVCSGIKTYTWTYTDCTGSSAPWVYTYTVSPPSFSLPADGGSTVACVSDAQIVPTPPTVTNSCGDPLTVSGPVVGPDPVCSGPKTYTWTYEDCTGATADWVYTYTVTPPSATAPAPGSATVACISDAQVVPTPPAVNNSCGDPLSVTGPVVSPDPVCSGTKTYTWTYTDCTGSTVQYVFTYTIDPPSATLPANGSATVACISDAQVVPMPPAVNNSCGDPLVITGPLVGPDPVCAGTKTYTWTYTDCTGAALTWIFTYTIPAPTLTLPANDGSTVPCIADAQVVPVPPVVLNSCGDPVIPTGPVVGPDPICFGTKTYTWTYTDCSGSAANWVYTYTIDQPTLTLPADDGSTVPCIADAQVVPVPPVVDDSCGNPVTPTGPVVGPDPLCSGTKTYTWTYTDCAGGSADWVYTYTITPATITLPPNDGSTVPCIADAQVVPTPPSVNDSCGDPVIPTGPVVSADPVCSGIKTYTWTYVDCAGTPTPWVYTYTINPPAFTLPADDGSTVGCINEAQAVPVPPAATNTCGVPLTITGPVVGPDPICSGTKTYTWTYTDCTGNAAQWVYTYTVSPPTFVLPADGGSTVACVADAQVTPIPPVVNNSCGDPLMVTGPVVGPDPVCSGTKTYTWTYTDCTGGSASWVYTYTVTPPTASLPGNDGSTVSCVSDAQVVPTPPNVNNSCGDPLSLTGPVVGPDPICTGTKTYTWTYTNCTGATADWIYTYTITPSTITLPPNDGATVACISDAQAVPTPPSVNDSCGDPVVPTGPVIGPDPVCSGTKTYTWTYTDCSGADTDWTFTYTINPPTLSLPPDDGSTVNCISDAQVVPTPPTVDDSCGNPVAPTGPVVSPDPVCSGTKTYSWTYTDCAGNAASWVYTYTINPPTVLIPGDDGSIVNCIADAQVVPTPPSVNDSCGDPVIPTGPVVSADPVCSGTKTYTWTYNDCAGSPVDWTYTYTILPPSFTPPANDGSTVACVSDAQTVPTPPGVTDSCGEPVIPTGPVVGPDPVCSGTKTYTWTYTDCAGTVTDWVYTYTISAPTFTLPADDGSTVACVSDAQVVPTPPAVNNSCGDPLTIMGPVVSPDPVCSGTKTYTWTYTDCTGSAADWTYIYTVTPPSLALPGDGGSTVTCLSDAQVVPTPPTVNNSCGDPLTITGPVVGPDPVCSGTKTYTWTYTDCTGTSADWVYTYTVLPPSLNLPPNEGSNVPCISDAQVVPTLPVVNDSCGDPVLPTSGPVVGPDPVCSGPKTYTWTYTDCSGATFDWVYTYTVDPPGLTLPPDAGSTVDCIIDAQVVPTPPSVSDSCGEPVIPTGPVVGADPACSGIKTYAWTYTDCAGNSEVWTYTYTILGDTGPVFSSPPSDVTVSCVADIPAMIDLDYTNSCSAGGSATGSDSQITGNCPATIVRTWTVTDACGNVATVTQNITINDTTPPTASAPPAIAVPGCNSPVPAPDVLVITDEADDCGTTPVVAFVGDATSLVGCIETTTRTYSITDGCNNSITVQQIITRTFDITPPVFDNPPFDVTVDCFGQIPPLEDLNYTDNCSGSGTVSGTQTGPVGTPPVYTYTWTATDDCGNPETLSVTITVNETNSTISVTESICPGDTVTIYGVDYFMAGMYMDTLPGMGGDCDTIVDIEIIQLLNNTAIINEDLCPNETVVINGEIYDMGGTYTDTLEGANGECDTILTIIINELDYILNTISEELCPDETVTINGEIYDMEGTYFDTITSTTGGCDTALTIIIDTLPYNLLTVNDSYCEGESVFVYGVEYNAEGTYFNTIPGSPAGCDTLVTIVITEQPVLTDTINYAGCSGDGFSVVVGGILFNEGNPMGDVPIDVPNGCDSLIHVDLQFAPFTQADINEEGPVCTTSGTITLTAVPPGGVWSGDVSSNLFDPALLGPGSHEVIYTINAGACSSADTIQISVYELVISCLALENESAPGAGDGEGQVTVSGGVAPYDVSWSGPVSGSITLNADGDFVIGGLTAGVYTVTVVDDLDCEATCQFTIMSDIPCEIIIDPVQTQDASCSGVDDGVATIFATGNFPPLEYSLDCSTYQTSNSFTGLAPGNYSFCVRDASGCIETGTFTIGVGPSPVFDPPVITNASCGVLNGEITVTATGGTLPYSYSLDCIVYSAVNIFTGLGAGTYQICLIDGAGCTDTVTATVLSANAPVIDNIIVTNSSCGQADGALEIIASGGEPPLMYSIDGGMTFFPDGDFPNLMSGIYPIVVKDNTGCETPGTATIQEIGGPTLLDITVTPTSCVANTGMINISATGGQPPLQYSIDCINYQPSPLFTGLGVGVYDICVRDDNGCIAVGQATINTVNGPNFTVDFENTSCGLENGSIELNITGGTEPYEIFLNGDSYGDETDIFDLPCSTIPYDILVEDANGCSAVAQVEIECSIGPEYDVYITPANCGMANGIIELDPTAGQSPFMYALLPGGFGPVFTFPGLVEDFYTVVVKDGNGCEVEMEVFVYSVDGPEDLDATIIQPDCGMNNGIIIVSADSSSNLMYQLVPRPFQEGPTFTNVAPGTYTINVRDEDGCTATIQVTMPATPAPNIINVAVVNSQCGQSTGSITINANGGVPPLEYSINGIGGPFVLTNVFTGLASGTYDIIVQGANDCQDTATAVITTIGGVESDVTAEICDGDSYIIDGEIFTTTGQYDVLIENGAQNGCDSTVHLDLTVNDLPILTLDTIICVNEVFTYNGTDYSMPGIFFLDTLQASGTDCDTLYFVNLDLQQLDTTYIDTAICSGSVYTINGVDYSVSGSYLIDTILAVVGCDLVRILNLDVNEFIQDTIVDEICEGEIYTIHGMNFTMTGIFLIDTFPNPTGCDTIRTLDLTVNPLPIVNAGPDMVLNCLVQTVTLDGSASSAGTPLWTGPGINAGNQNDLTPDVTQPGIYTLTITSSDNCQASDMAEVTLDPASVVANAGIDDSLSCEVMSITLQGNPSGPNYSYLWDGPGINTNNEDLQNPVITQAGIYSLIVTDDISGCVSLPDTVVIVDLVRSIVAIIQGPNELDCFTDTIDLATLGSTTGPTIQYIWFNENGDIISNSPDLIVSQAGTFMFTVTDTLSGCADSASINIADLTQYPQVNAGADQVIDCNNPTVVLNQDGGGNDPDLEFLWIGPAGGINTDPTGLAVTVDMAGTYYLIATDTALGCQNRDSVVVTDNTVLPIADIHIINGLTCVDSSALLDIGISSTGPAFIHSWNGPGFNGVQADTIAPVQAGTYFLTVINQTSGCQSRDTIILTEPVLPSDMLADIEIPLCLGDTSGSISIQQVTGGVPPYMYSLNGGLLQSDPEFLDLPSGPHVVEVTDANGCTYQEAFVIPDGDLFTIDLGPDLELELGDSAILNPIVSLPWSMVDSLVWFSPDHLSCSHCINPTFYALFTETITATVYSGGCLAQDMITIRVDVDANIYVPNVFTPDHDGINDYVTVFADPRVRKVLYLEIFDRWGNQVFVGENFLPNDPLAGWDGTFRGKPMNPAVFAFIAKVELINGETIRTKGDITLIR